MKTIPISVAQAIADSHALRQVIVLAWDGKTSYVVTYGTTDEDSATAAMGGNRLKKAMRWTEDLDTESAKVRALKNRIKELESLLSKSHRSEVHVIEGTEYERGWGCRPDGFIAFASKGDAEKFITEYNAKYNSAPSAPDCYTTYEYVGVKPCSPTFLSAVLGNKLKHFNSAKELG